MSTCLLGSITAFASQEGDSIVNVKTDFQTDAISEYLEESDEISVTFVADIDGEAKGESLTFSFPLLEETFFKLPTDGIYHITDLAYEGDSDIVKQTGYTHASVIKASNQSETYLTVAFTELDQTTFQREYDFDTHTVDPTMDFEDGEYSKPMESGTDGPNSPVDIDESTVILEESQDSDKYNLFEGFLPKFGALVGIFAIVSIVTFVVLKTKGLIKPKEEE